MRPDPSNAPADAPSGGLSARVTASDAGMEAQDVQGAPGGSEGPSTASGFDGCIRDCHKARVHTYRWPGCEFAPEPEPTVSLSCVYNDHDGYPSIGFDAYTVQQLADLIAPALITPEDGFALPYDEDYGRALAMDAARAIFRRNDPQPDRP